MLLCPRTACVHILQTMSVFEPTMDFWRTPKMCKFFAENVRIALHHQTHLHMRSVRKQWTAHKSVWAWASTTSLDARSPKTAYMKRIVRLLHSIRPMVDNKAYITLSLVCCTKSDSIDFRGVECADQRFILLLSMCIVRIAWTIIYLDKLFASLPSLAHFAWTVSPFEHPTWSREPLVYFSFQQWLIWMMFGR